MNNAALGITYGLVAMVCFGLMSVWYRPLTSRMNSIKISFYRNGFISVIFLLSFPFLPISRVEINNYLTPSIIYGLAIGFIGFLSQLTILKAVQKEKLGIVTPIANSAIAPTVLFSMIFFHESLGGAGQLLAMLAILIGIILITINPKDIKTAGFRISAGVLYALATCLLWGIAFGWMKKPINIFGPILTSMTIEVSVFIYGAITMKIKGESFSCPDGYCLKYLILIAVAAFIASLSVVFGYAAYKVNVVSALFFSNPIVVAVYSYFIYKEKLSRLQLAAATLIMAGIIGVCVL